MRDIKFRAWIKNEQRLTYQNEWYGLVVDQNGLYYIHYGEADQLYYNNDEIILMQYIGLKDKNGKEIYEGDIIKQEIYNLTGGKETRVYNIYYERNYFVFPACNVNIEVIGNIYENPELLDVDK